MSFTVDGVAWDMPCKIEREAKMTASEISGMMLDKNYFNDVLGTFMVYDVTIAVPVGHEAEYSALYEVLTDPVDAHTFVLPYNQGVITLTARVNTVSDELWRQVRGVNVWRRIKFTVTANHPSKEHSLDEAIRRGVSPMPDMEYEPQIGDVYRWTADGWEKLSLVNGDNVAY